MSKQFIPCPVASRCFAPLSGGNRSYPQLNLSLAVRLALGIGVFAVILFLLGPFFRRNHANRGLLANQEILSRATSPVGCKPSDVTAPWLGRALATNTPVGQSEMRTGDRLPGQVPGTKAGPCFGQSDAKAQKAFKAEELQRIEATLARWCRTVPSAMEGRLLAEAQCRHLAGLELLTAAILAGGSPPQKVPSLLERFENQRRRIQVRIDPQVAPRVRLRQAFRGLHAEILHGGYDIAASNPGEAIQTGRFNCVSASLLFKLIAEFLGFEVQVVETPTHAYCRVKCENAWVPVECTSPHWLDGAVNPAGLEDWPDSKEKDDEANDQRWLGRPMVSKSSRSDWQRWGEGGRDVSDTQLLGTIYYNRGVAALLDRQFETAVVTNLRAVQLDPESRSARDNLLASLNNWAIALAERGEYAEAASRLHLALEIRPDSKPIQANLYRVYREWKNSWRRHGGDAEEEIPIRESIRLLPSDGRCGDLRRKVEALLRE